MAKLDGKYIMVETEAPDYPVTVTEQPVEKGVNLVDHVQAGAWTMSLSGLIVGPDADKIRAHIIAVKDKAKVVKYIGRNRFTGVITAFSTSHDYTVANGMTFSMDLREVRVATSSYVATLPAPVKAQAAVVANKGTQQPKNKSKGKGKGKSGKKTSSTSTKDKKATSASSVINKPTRAPIKPGNKWGTGNLM
ncbi:hypothetical protein KIH86_03675 [Paenibacillus sp. HN-1]|uniref:phage baseplate protein n=1 Tax=Paenibacillus TaxID=44249 RepID=UPI001CA87E10|nr:MULTISPECIES: hypothetical protein [Paenibacillus]MBY9077282.1 hypothetical protein [Paenibacillus sp. CGMCC 1.18879]MBY9083329.1 hypothetical protein [Paenibacillus sinensis]